MTSPSEANPFAKYLTPPKPLPGPRAEDAEEPEAAAVAPVNPFARYRKEPDTNAAPAAPPPKAAPVAEQIADPFSWEAMKSGVTRAGKTYLDLQDAIRNTVGRSMFKAGEMAFLPADADHDVSRFIMSGDYSLPALRQSFVYGPNDPTRPSADAEAWLAAHSVAPRTTAGAIAEDVNSALLGAKFPGMPPSPRAGLTAPTVADEVIAAGERHNVPTYLDDLTKSAWAKRLGVGAEYMPLVGTSAGRAKQAKAAQDAAEALRASFAREIADDVPVVMQKGLQDQLATFRSAADARYTQASKLLDQAGEVPTPRFVKAIRAELANQKQLGSASNPDVINLLEKYQEAPTGNFSLQRLLRSQLKGEISGFYEGAQNKAIGKQGVERLRSLRDALEGDMEDFAKKTGGEAYKSWKDADTFYKTNLGPFKERGFADLVRTAEPEKAWRYLMTQGGIESRADRMYNALNDSGRAAVRSGVINDAMEKALTPGRKGAIFSPAKFARYMESNKTVIDRFFQGADKEEISGFTNLMRHVERAGQHMENPPTGQRLLGLGALVGAPGIATGDVGVALKALAVSGTMAGATRVLFQTQRGRDLLLAASRMKPGSPAMSALGNRISRLMAAGAMTHPGLPEEEDNSDAVSQ